MAMMDDARARQLTKPRVARAIRLEAGVTQEAVAASLGVRRVSVARWEAGERRPRGDLLLRYAEALRQLQEVGVG